MTTTIVRCRATDTHSDRCTAEAADPLAELPLCTRHGAEVLRALLDTGIVQLAAQPALIPAGGAS